MAADINVIDENSLRLENATIVDQSPADPRLIQIQNGGVQQVDDDEPQTPKIYHFQNCGMVYVDSLNARNVAMDNCGNQIPQTQVTYHRPRNSIDECEKSDKVSQSQSRPVVTDPSSRTARTEIFVSVDYVVLFSWAVFVAVFCLAFFIINSPRLCGIGEGTFRM